MSTRWMRRILRLAPKAFRERYVDEIVATHEARSRRMTGWRSGLFAVRELAGAVWLVVRLRLDRDHPRAPAAAETLRPTPFATTWQDARFALRTLRRSPGFTAAAVTILAVGIGANVAIFSAANAYFFRPLPFEEPDRLVTVFETNPEFGWVDEVAAPANLLDWREQVDAFADVSGYVEATDEITAFREGEPVLVTGAEVLGNFFSTLGVPAALGRAFRFGETWLGDDNVVVISHDLWIEHYGSDPDVIGRTFEFATHAPEVIGVMPAGFSFPSDGVELWYPVGCDPAATEAPSFRRAHWIRAFARLESGVSLEEADAQLQVVVGRLQDEYPETNEVMGAGIVPMRDFLVRDARTPLLILLGAVSLLLLLACTNVANLMLVRAAERSREVAMRRALGAGRRRIVRQMLTESLILSALGAAVGVVLGWIAVRAAATSIQLGIDGATLLTLDHRVVLFTCGAATLSAVLFGVMPALRSAGVRAGALPQATRGMTAGGAGLRTVGALVAVEVALAVLLVVGAGLMMRTAVELGRVDPGFRTDGVLAVQYAVQSADYPSRDEVLSFYDRFAEALEARPGVERVGQVGRLPLDGPNWSSEFQAEGWPPDRAGVEILHRRADPGYFEALHVPLLRGRMYSPDDTRALLINEALATEYFPSEDPVGQRIAFTRSATPQSIWWEIIGVVGDQHQTSLAQPVRPEVFENRNQDWGRNNWTVLRVQGEPMSHVPTVRAVLQEMDPRIPLASVRTLDEVRGGSLAREELVLGLLGAFGLAALVLAALGVYAVSAVAARRRTQEIGIRMALGAGSGDVLAMTLRRGLVVVGVGLLIGLAASLAATRALESLLYGVEPTDPGTLAAVVALLGGVALLACYLPARRAAAVDPALSLRVE